MVSTDLPQLAIEERALASTDQSSARAMSAPPNGCISHSKCSKVVPKPKQHDLGARVTITSVSGRCTHAKPRCQQRVQCKVIDLLGSSALVTLLWRLRPPMQPPLKNALMDSDASFANRERVRHAVDTASAAGPCGGRSRRRPRVLRNFQSIGPFQSNPTDW